MQRITRSLGDTQACRGSTFRGNTLNRPACSIAVTVTTIAILAWVACSGKQGQHSNPLLRDIPLPATEVQEGCRIALDKCTRCHTIDRLIAARVSEPEGWQFYVRRMRLMPGARILGSEVPAIVNCLVYRSFGREGLMSLEEAAP